MSPIAAAILEQLVTAYRQGRRLVLTFDYDGTLTPLVAHPSLAQLDPALRVTLGRLAALPRVTLGMVSGRALDDLIAMVGLPGLCYGGSTGLELELAGQRQMPAAALASQPLLERLTTLIESRLPGYPGAWVETKPFGFTIHYRHLAPDLAAPLLAELAAVLEPHAAGLHILDGPLALEVIPSIALDKGTALRAIAAASDDGPATVLFAGDAANDAPTLATATQLGGIALGIGPDPPPVATHRLADPAALGALLAALVDRLSANPHP